MARQVDRERQLHQPALPGIARPQADGGILARQLPAQIGLRLIVGDDGLEHVGAAGDGAGHGGRGNAGVSAGAASKPSHATSRPSSAVAGRPSTPAIAMRACCARRCASSSARAACARVRDRETGPARRSRPRRALFQHRQLPIAHGHDRRAQPRLPARDQVIRSARDQRHAIGPATSARSCAPRSRQGPPAPAARRAGRRCPAAGPPRRPAAMARTSTGRWHIRC
jgi:hypothetical protein